MLCRSQRFEQTCKPIEAKEAATVPVQVDALSGILRGGLTPGACREQGAHLAHGHHCGPQAVLKARSDCESACAAGRNGLSQPTSPWT